MMTQQCTCFAREPGECACGAWDDVDPALWDDDAPMTTKDDLTEQGEKS